MMLRCTATHNDVFILWHISITFLKARIDNSLYYHPWLNTAAPSAVSSLFPKNHVVIKIWAYVSNLPSAEGSRVDLLERGFCSVIQINSQIKDSNRLIPLQLHPICPTCRHARMKHPSLICLCKTAVSRTSTPFVTTHWFDKRSVFRYMMCTQYWIPGEEQRLAYNSPAFNNSAEIEYLFLKTMGVS